MLNTLPSALSRAVAAALILLVVAGCTRPDGTVSRADVFDPFEEQNRRAHEFNVSLDRGVVRPVSKGYGLVIPLWLQAGIGNFSRNLGQPRVILNNLLQGDIENAGLNTLRFAMNTTFGVGGIFDPATEARIPLRETDFGVTMHVWGVPEGAYLELPFWGPTTERDIVGSLVNFAIDPLSWALPLNRRYARIVADVADGVGERDRLSETIDSVLYDSEDSYAQTRLIYLQNRAFELGSSSANTSEDPYLDPYGDGDTAAVDPFFDPYEDPYAQ